MGLTVDELFRDATTSIDKGFDQQQVGTYEKFSDDIEGRWTGKVIDNDDPDKLGRVKIIVFGYYDDLAEFALPWAVPDIGYVGGTNGSFIIPEVGSFVRGYFDQGDIQKPVYDSIAFSEMTAQNTTKNMLINKLEDYPHKMVLMETDQGDYMTLNRKDGETVFHHRSGLDITIGADGSLTINAGMNYNQNGNIKINCYGDTNIETNGDVSLKSTTGNVNIDAVQGDINLGRNTIKRLINNLPICPVTGLDHCVGNTNVKC